MVTLIGAGWALATSGLLFAAAGFLIAALGRRTTMADRPKPQTVLLSLGVNAPLWIAVAAGFAMGVCFNIFGVLWNTTMQREIPAESLSRVSSYDALGSLMFGPLGMLAAGPVSEAVGARHALLGCAAIVSLATLAALTSPAVRHLRARPAEDPQLRVPATSAA